MIKAVEKFGKVCIAKLINRFEKKTFLALDILEGKSGLAVVKDSASPPSSRNKE